MKLQKKLKLIKKIKRFSTKWEAEEQKGKIRKIIKEKQSKLNVYKNKLLL